MWWLLYTQYTSSVQKLQYHMLTHQDPPVEDAKRGATKEAARVGRGLFGFFSSTHSSAKAAAQEHTDDALAADKAVAEHHTQTAVGKAVRKPMRTQMRQNAQETALQMAAMLDGLDEQDQQQLRRCSGVQYPHEPFVAHYPFAMHSDSVSNRTPWSVSFNADGQTGFLHQHNCNARNRLFVCSNPISTATPSSSAEGG